MEIDLIFLPKNNSLSYQDIKDEFDTILKDLFANVTDDSFFVELTSGNHETIEYKCKVEGDRILYFQIKSDLSEMRAAEVLDFTANKILKGEHRKNYDIIISYNETALVYCNKLMPLFGEFERRLRQILYITLVKAFQVDWLNQSFQQSLIDEIKSKSGINKNKLIENALEELTYEQLKTFLFVPFTSVNIEQVLENGLSETEIQKKSKDEIIEIINSCRKNSLWNMFFKTEKTLLSIPDEIEYYQPYRNKVMHNKNINYEEFVKVRKKIKQSNNNLQIAISQLEVSIYHQENENSVVDVINVIESLYNMQRLFKNLYLLAKITQAAVKAIKNLSSISLSTKAANAIQNMTNYSQSFTRLEDTVGEQKTIDEGEE